MSQSKYTKKMNAFDYELPSYDVGHEMTFEYTLGRGILISENNKLISEVTTFLSKYTGDIRRSEFGIIFNGYIPLGVMRTLINFYNIPYMYYRNSADSFVIDKSPGNSHMILYHMTEESEAEMIWDTMSVHEGSAISHWRNDDYKCILPPAVLKIALADRDSKMKQL